MCGTHDGTVDVEVVDEILSVIPPMFLLTGALRRELRGKDLVVVEVKLYGRYVSSTTFQRIG